MPYLYNLRTDPCEFARVTSNAYWDWYIDRAFVLYTTKSILAPFHKFFEEFPLSEKPGSFLIGDAMNQVDTPNNQYTCSHFSSPGAAL